MARPRKYHTPEEERLARNERSRRSYAKNQPSIRKRRNKLYHKESKKVGRAGEPVSSNLGETTKGGNKCSDTQNVAFWIQKIENIDAKLNEQMGGDNHIYCERVLERYLEVGEDELTNTILEDVCHQFDDLQSEVRRCQDAILQLTGVDKEWSRAEEVMKRISQTANYLNDMCSYTLLPAGELCAAHKRKDLMYQIT